MMKALVPCCQVYSPNGRFSAEYKDRKTLRTISRRAVLETQPPVFPFMFTAVWSLAMFVLMLAGTVWPFLAAASVFGSDIFVVSWFGILVGAIHSLFLVMWLTFSIVNFVHYHPRKKDAIGKRGNRVSFFAMEQIQQVLSELSLYPQLCLACTSLTFPRGPYGLFALFVVSILLLLAVFVLRIVTVWRMRVFFKSYFVRLIFSFVANYVNVLLLLAVLLITSPDVDAPLQIIVFFLVLTTTVWNQLTFYHSHLYEITLQSGVNVVQLLDDSEGRNALRVIREMQNLETFHKNMYPLSKPGTGTLLYLWIIPSVAVTIYTVIAYINNFSVMIPVVVWFFLNAAINYKTLLLSCSAHFTSFVILLLITTVCALSMAFTMVIYGLIVLAIALIILRAVFDNVKEDN